MTESPYLLEAVDFLDKKALLEEINRLNIENEKINQKLTWAEDVMDSAIIAAEKAKQEKHLQVIMDNSPDIVILLDSAMNFLLSTKAFLKLAGIEDIKFLHNKSFRQVFSSFSDDVWLEHMENIFQKALKTSEIQVSDEKTDIGASGNLRHYSVSVAPFSYGHEINDGLLVTFRDLTDIINSRDKLEAVANNYKGLIWSVDANLVVTTFKGQYTKLLEPFSKLVEGNKIAVAPINKLHLDALNRVEKTFSEGPQDWISEVKDRIYRSSTSPIYDDKGNIIGVVGSTDDVTETVKLQHALELQTSTFKAILDSIPDFVFCKDLNYKYTLCNKSIEDFFGVHQEDLIGKDYLNALGASPEMVERNRETDRVVVEESRSVVFEESISSVDGTVLLCETVKVPILKNGVVIGIAGISRDITERKAHEDELQATSRAKSEFLAKISHEIRTPLNAIMGLSEVELRNNLNSSTRENIEKIHRSGNILLSLINDILDISKIESGNFEIIQGNYDFPNMISDTINLNLVRLASKPVVFEPQIDEDVPTQLYGDELRVKQILNNLLSNAFKYTEKGKVNLNITCVRMENEALLEYVVSDTGIGMTKENLEKLFSDYQQFDTWANRKIEGTGLGLAISKKLVDMMGGTIEAESEYGKGSKFTVRLTQGIEDTTPIGKEVAQNLRTFRMLDSRRDKDIMHVPIPGGKILVVDDVATNLEVAKGLMAPYTLTIHCASSGKQAIEIIKEDKTRYDAIFMDHMMPEMDGIEAARLIREEIGTEYAKTVPIIALTANALVGNEKIFLEKGFQAFLSKPIDAVKLDKILNEWVRKGHTENMSIPDNTGVISNSNADEQTYSIAKHHIEGVDLTAGVSRFGKEDVYLQVIHSYVTHTPALLEKLRPVNAEMLDEYAITIHGIKGSSYGIHANEAGKMAEELEIAAKRGDIETVKSGTDAFIRIVQSLISQLSALENAVGNKITGIQKEIKAEPDNALLEKFLKCCIRYDMAGMEDIISELDQYEYESQGDLVQWLRMQLDALEYDNIRQRLENVVLSR